MSPWALRKMNILCLRSATLWHESRTIVMRGDRTQPQTRVECGSASQLGESKSRLRVSISISMHAWATGATTGRAGTGRSVHDRQHDEGPGSPGTHAVHAPICGGPAGGACVHEGGEPTPARGHALWSAWRTAAPAQEMRHRARPYVDRSGRDRDQCNATNPGTASSSWISSRCSVRRCAN